MNKKLYSLGAIMRYLEADYGSILNKEEEAQLKFRMNQVQKDIDKMEEVFK